MSFAKQTKASLVKLSQSLKHDCCRRAELYGILYGAGVFTRERIKLVTSSEELAALCTKRLEDLYGIDANMYVTEKKSGDDRCSCKITVVQKKDLARLFYQLRYEDAEAAHSIKEEMFKCDTCRPAFVRGVFLSAATVTDPDKSYHLELDFTAAAPCENLRAFLSKEGITPKHMTRKNEEVLYYKDSESIENFLAYIGANNAAFEIMNKKIERGIRSDMNRIANGEVANIGKTAKAATSQIAVIRALKESGELERMPDELKITANLRLEHSDASLLRLAELHTPPITKSGVNHRLKKILEWKA